MSRYIEVESLKDSIRRNFSSLMCRTEINSIIDMQPTADVKPVVRAKWFDDFTSDWVCTNCLQPSPSKRYKYCPNCGARMVEE